MGDRSNEWLVNREFKRYRVPVRYMTHLHILRIAAYYAEAE